MSSLGRLLGAISSSHVSEKKSHRLLSSLKHAEVYFTEKMGIGPREGEWKTFKKSALWG